MVTLVWVNIGSSNGLFLDGTKQLPEWMLIADLSLVQLCGIHLGAISLWVPNLLFCSDLWNEFQKIILLKLLSHLSGVSSIACGTGTLYDMNKS